MLPNVSWGQNCTQWRITDLKKPFSSKGQQKKKEEKEGCGSKRSRHPAATRVTYVVGPAVPLSPLHQHNLGDDQRGEDQDHLHVHGLVAPVHLVHPFLLQAGTSKGGHLQKASTFACLAKKPQNKTGWAHRKQLGISNVRVFKL